MKAFSLTSVAYPAILLVATAFACGTGSGADADVTGAVHADAVAADVLRDHDDVLAELRVELGLSGEQFAQLQEIFARRHAESEAAWAQAHANHGRTMQAATTEIEAILDSAQIKGLHAWLAKRHGPTSRHAPGHGH